MLHEIKLNENFCDAVLEGRKTFEVRKNDRGYQTGDFIKFIPLWSSGVEMQSHPLKHIVYEITYVLSGWGIDKDYVVFSFKEKEDARRVEAIS